MALTLVLGGARSGKSRWGEKLAAQNPPVTYIATAEARDLEMTRRIARHQAERPGDWSTVEAPYDLLSALNEASKGGSIIIDCLTLYISNLLEKYSQEDVNQREKLILAEVEAVASLSEGHPANIIIISNEVGLGLVPPSALGREFRDLCGWANQRLAKRAQRVYYTVAGIALDIKELGVDIFA
ncbi:MAG: bifunctional adenosylcobinamide kinase/adenosylcobinamide-phosphate guanylyltransferase [Limnochordia bacterium]|jgi:adenosylcobinamide kinase/adenosylcobinamide-phosphate guanylyltransferase